jgi:hypothetical protein
LINAGKRLDPDRCHAFRITETKTLSLAEHVNLLAKHAKQKPVVIDCNNPIDER